MEKLPAGLSVLGPDGRDVELASLASRGPVLLAFLRHFG